MGIYQRRYLDRVPAHAAIHESVELVKRAGKRSAAGFANAVLRKVDREPIAWPSREIELAHPAWLLERWDRQFGQRRSTNSIARANLQTPQTYRRGDRIQDIGIAIDRAAARTGERPDVSRSLRRPWKQDRAGARSRSARRGLRVALEPFAPMKSLGIDLVTLDATKPLPFRGQFDRIWWMRRAPAPARWRTIPRSSGDCVRKGSQSYRRSNGSILHNALEVLAPRGRLVYSTCSLDREENEDVIAGLTYENNVATCPDVIRATAFSPRLSKNNYCKSSALKK